MHRFNRRDTIKIGAGALAGTLLGSTALRAEIPTADVQPPDLPIEDGAQLTVLRPSKFVGPDEDIFRSNTAKFTEEMGVPVKLEFESWEDLRPKTAVAANVGSGPDIVVAWSDDPQTYVDKIVDMTDLATYLGEKYGGWWPLAERYGKDSETGNWIAMPIGASGGRVVYRKSKLEAAGHQSVPEDVDGFLKMAQDLQKAGTPMGLALGNAVGDANAWCNWVVWAFGGKMVDDEENVVINSPETIEALKYAKALSETFIPGCLSWLDSNNNKAYLADEISLTQNGISIYFAAKNSDDPAIQKIAEDTFHSRMPIGPVGMPTERALVVNSMIFKHSPYPNAAKQYLRFMMEKEQYSPWLEGCLGYWNHPLQAYDSSPVWEPEKVKPYQHVMKDSLWDGYSGKLGAASSAVLADFVMVQMVASVCAGQSTPEEAASEAERRAQRYYR
ncbi:MAG: extracellular solute-binding protein [Geminicoccaceae bacterium]|nr:extracellular solute-binding protein [Geminicoccaceae bacterium]